MSYNIYLIVGKSGTGKTTMVNRLQNLGPQVQSYTTRPKRSEDETGHIFVTDEEFDRLQNICAYTEYNGYRYAATQEQVDNATFYVIDPEGVWYFVDHYKGDKEIRCVYIKASLWRRFWRLLQRDGLIKAIKRIWIDHFAFDGFEVATKTVIVNHDLKEATDTLWWYVGNQEWLTVQRRLEESNEN